MLNVILVSVKKMIGSVGTSHRNKLAYQLRQLATSISVEYPQQSGSPRNSQNHQEQQKAPMSDRQDEAENHIRKIPWPLKNSERKYEYLSLVLPRSPTDQVQIHGCPAFVGEEYLRNAARMLAILRVVSMSGEDSLSVYEQARAARILREEACPLCGSSFEISKHCRLQSYRQPK